MYMKRSHLILSTPFQLVHRDVGRGPLELEQLLGVLVCDSSQLLFQRAGQGLVSREEEVIWEGRAQCLCALK